MTGMFKQPGNPHLLRNLQLSLTVADSESALAHVVRVFLSKCNY